MFGWRNQLERALHDCPWMWAVNSHWSRGDQIIFRPIVVDSTMLYSNCDPKLQWWVMCSCDEGYVYQEVARVYCLPELIVAEAIFRTRLMSNRDLKYLVGRKTDETGKYIIYRAPRMTTLFDLCLCAKNETIRARQAQAEGRVGMF